MNENLNLFASVRDHEVVRESAEAGSDLSPRSARLGTDLLPTIVTVACLLLAWQLFGWLAWDVRDVPTMSAANLMLATLFQGGRARGAQRRHGDARKAPGTMQALVIAGLAAVTSILAAVLTHAATNSQAYI